MLPLAEFIAQRYKRVAEIGIGNNVAVAELLKSKGVSVIATDVRKIKTSVEFYIDDIINPRLEIYRGVELVYSIRPPPELFSAIRRLSKLINADCIIKPLYGDFCDGKLINYKGVNFYLWRRSNI
ncbi:MAG: UPF0146 family protein [Archaeoglobaceae archaeon]